MAKLDNSYSPSGVKKNRKGIHSKSKTSKLKTSKHYKKRYRGQGK
jgi:hypothetical protein